MRVGGLKGGRVGSDEEWFNGAYQASGRRVQRCLQRGTTTEFQTREKRGGGVRGRMKKEDIS